MASDPKPFACRDVAGVIRSMEKLVYENDVPTPKAFQASFASFCGGLDPSGLPENFFPRPSNEAQMWQNQVVDELSRGMPAPTPTASTSQAAPSVEGGIRFHFANGEEVFAEESSAQKQLEQAKHTLDFYLR
jgi:hypothetical protein